MNGGYHLKSGKPDTGNVKVPCTIARPNREKRKGIIKMFKAWWEIPEFLKNVYHNLESVFDYCYEQKIPQEEIQIIDVNDCYLPVAEHLQDKVVSVAEYELEDGEIRYVFRAVP